MGPRSIGRFLRRARDRLRRIRQTRSATSLRGQIYAALADPAVGRPTPYFGRLAEAVGNTAELSLLKEVRRTLQYLQKKDAPAVPAGPLVSIVMPVHDRREVVGEAIRSVLDQSYGRFEFLICDDGSRDGTAEALQPFSDDRIRSLSHAERRGAAAARNTCLQAAQGELIAYLDSDNLWHPRFLELAVAELQAWPGHQAVYASYFDLQIDDHGKAAIRAAAIRPFDLEDQIDKPFVDLNSFVHRRVLLDTFGGFDERLQRRQDYDLIARYTWTREPRHIPFGLNLYQRSARLRQITQVHGADLQSPAIIRDKIEAAYRDGMRTTVPPWLRKVTVVSWDMSRNHFAKAYSVAEALSRRLEVELVSFRFFEDPIFPPLASATPSFTTHYFDGADFPGFFETMERAVEVITGDVIYAVKPRLPSLGLALLANAAKGTPVFLEANDLETVVSAPTSTDRHHDLPLSAILDRPDEARVPHAQIWSQVLDRCAQQLPTIFTHNTNLDEHYGRRCLTMRNIKDQAIFDPALYNRDEVRAELGFGAKERVILFGGLVRRHKGIFELADFVGRLGDPYRLLVVGSRETPDLRALTAQQRRALVVLPPQPPERMAALNAAADVVVLWLDPAVPASHFQSPYKMTDALAMGPAIIASPVGDFPQMAERGLLRTVPYGDFAGLSKAVRATFADPKEQVRRQGRARRLFLRDYSYNSVLPALAPAAQGLAAPRRTYPVAADFAAMFSAFRARSEASGRPPAGSQEFPGRSSRG